MWITILDTCLVKSVTPAGVRLDMDGFFPGLQPGLVTFRASGAEITTDDGDLSRPAENLRLIWLFAVKDFWF